MRTTLLAMLLLGAGCSTTPQYQGDVVLGAFAFNATVREDTCNLDAGGFAFVGVLSYDSAKQELFLDTDGDPKDDHVGSLSGRHFVLTNSAQRETHCNYPVNVVETLQGDLLDVPGGCASLLPDGGLPDGGGIEPLDGGAKDLVASVICGSIVDVSPDTSDGGASCGGCQLGYQLTGTLQSAGGSP